MGSLIGLGWGAIMVGYGSLVNSALFLILGVVLAAAMMVYVDPEKFNREMNAERVLFIGRKPCC